MNRRGIPPREGVTIVDPLTMQILRRTGTEGTVRQKVRGGGGDRKGANDDVPNEGAPGGLSEVARNMDAQPQVKEKKFVFLSIQSRQARLTKHVGKVFLSSVV